MRELKGSARAGLAGIQHPGLLPGLRRCVGLGHHVNHRVAAHCNLERLGTHGRAHSMLGPLRRNGRQAGPFLTRHLGHAAVRGQEHEKDRQKWTDDRRNQRFRACFRRPVDHCIAPFFTLNFVQFQHSCMESYGQFTFHGHRFSIQRVAMQKTGRRTMQKMEQRAPGYAGAC